MAETSKTPRQPVSLDKHLEILQHRQYLLKLVAHLGPTPTLLPMTVQLKGDRGGGSSRETGMEMRAAEPGFDLGSVLQRDGPWAPTATRRLCSNAGAFGSTASSTRRLVRPAWRHGGGGGGEPPHPNSSPDMEGLARLSARQEGGQLPLARPPGSHG